MKTSSIRSFVAAAMLAGLLLVPHETQAQDTMAAARDLYQSAAYEDALALLNRMDSSASQPSDRFTIDQYKAFCLVALRRTREAEDAIEAVLSVEPFYHPSEGEASPRLLSAFAIVRQRVLPAIVQQKYLHAKAAFDHQEFAAAAAEFNDVLRAFDDADLIDAARRPPLADVRTLATGFRDLSVRAAVPAPPPVAEPPAQVSAPPPAVPVAVPMRIYNAADRDASPPVIVRQELPAFPRSVVPAGQGVLEVVISEAGTVEAAVMRTSINPRYDGQVLAATRTWKFKAATVGGTPVKFRKMISISIKPGS
jgi:hypothetical protein